MGCVRLRFCDTVVPPLMQTTVFLFLPGAGTWGLCADRDSSVVNQEFVVGPGRLIQAVRIVRVLQPRPAPLADPLACRNE